MVGQAIRSQICIDITCIIVLRRYLNKVSKMEGMQKKGRHF